MLALLTKVTCLQHMLLFLICLFKWTWSWYTAAEMELELDISLDRYNMFSIIWVLFQHSAEESWVFPNSVAALLVRENCFGLLIAFTYFKYHLNCLLFSCMKPVWY